MSVIEKGSTVLVTGANGFIASHIVDQLIIAGYNVRGTVRTESKGNWLKEHFDAKYGAGKLEIVAVPDMAVEGAFNEAVKGQLVVHIRYLTLDSDIGGRHFWGCPRCVELDFCQRPECCYP